MATQADMKARIADELARDDLTSQIALAIADAIAVHQNDRTLFNESRDLTFSTVALQQFYTNADVPGLSAMLIIDQVSLTYGVSVWELDRRRPEDLEIAAQSAQIRGQPTSYSFYNRTLRLYAVPDNAYSIRVTGQTSIAAPASDTEAANPWMNEAERLIRSRAKLELYLHVIKDTDKAQVMKLAADDALANLKSQLNGLVGTGSIQATRF